MDRLIDDRYGNQYRLQSGRTFYANGGIIGIGPDCGAEGLSEGYDGGIPIVCDWDEDFAPWTAAERAELADEMIRRWTVFKGAAS